MTSRCSRTFATTSQPSTPTWPTASSTTTPVAEGLPLYERQHIHEQLHKALDRKVWLPSGGSLIIEHTEALTVIDVNTGKNVGTSNLEETVYRNNLEAAEEVAKQLRLRDIGGIVVIDFIDMEIKDNRKKVVDAFRSRAGPRQDPHAGVRHLRARAGGDDPQAHRRGPARQLRRPVPELRRPRRHHRPRPAGVTVDRANSASYGPLLSMVHPLGSHGYVRSDRIRWEARPASQKASRSTSSCSTPTTAATCR